MTKRAVVMVIISGAMLGCGGKPAQSASDVAYSYSRRLEVEGTIRPPIGNPRWNGEAGDADVVKVKVITITTGEKAFVRSEVSSQPTPGVPLELTFHVGDSPASSADDATTPMRTVTDASGVARFELKGIKFPERLCAIRKRYGQEVMPQLYGRVVIANATSSEVSSNEHQSFFDVGSVKPFCPASYAAVAAAGEHAKAEEAQNKAEFDALTIEEARTVWRNPPPRAPGEAWAHTELLRKKFCDEDHPQTADGQVCFLVGENWVRRGDGKEAGQYFEMACKLGVRAGCERDEYKIRITERRQRANDVVGGAREAVAQNLKAPSQASWGAASIIDRSGSCNLVKLSVDAPNAFGVMLHGWWLVTITRQGEKLGVVTSGAGPSPFDHEPSDGEVKIYKKLSAWEQCR